MKTITVNELKEKLEKDPGLHLLDVREPAENAEFNIGGTLLPLGHVMSMQTEDIAEWQNEEVICYCRSGMRSMQAAMMLESLGFTNVTNLSGGMLAWQETSSSE